MTKDLKQTLVNNIEEIFIFDKNGKNNKFHHLTFKENFKIY